MIKLKLLVFEYSCIVFEENLVLEGFDILKSILNDLDKTSIFDVTYLVTPAIVDLNLENCSRIEIEDDLCLWLDRHCIEYDYCLFVAPEDNQIQYNLTKILEKHNITLLNSGSHASFISSSKNMTYEKVPDSILKIPSQLIKLEDTKKVIEEHDFNKNKLVIKPDDKTSSELIFILEKRSNIDKIIREYKENDVKHVLIQDYVDGIDISVSLVVNDNNITFLSINRQNIVKNSGRLIFNGCKTRIENPLEDEIVKISEKIIRSIEGLKGFIGMDYIISNSKIYFVEINARLTTSFITLSETCNENLTEEIIKHTLHGNNMNLKFNESLTYYKGGV